MDEKLDSRPSTVMMTVQGESGGDTMQEFGQHDRQGTGAGLMDFLEYSMQRGLVSPQTGANYIVASRDILSITVGQDWMLVDVTALDFDEVRRRLVTAKGEIQLSRFDQHFMPAIRDFRAYLGLPTLADPLQARVSSQADSSPSDPTPDPSRLNVRRQQHWLAGLAKRFERRGM